jgi:hypothetical protein
MVSKGVKVCGGCNRDLLSMKKGSRFVGEEQNGFVKLSSAERERLRL